MTTYTIDANGKAIGRVASEAAVLLRGKGAATFERNKLPIVMVTIINASKLKLTDRKLTQKKYTRYSGYPGGLKQPKMNEVIAKRGYKEIVWLAVYGMLPGNKLRPRILKHLTITE